MLQPELDVEMRKLSMRQIFGLAQVGSAEASDDVFLAGRAGRANVGWDAATHILRAVFAALVNTFRDCSHSLLHVGCVTDRVSTLC
jgi:hypothetical protein